MDDAERIADALAQLDGRICHEIVNAVEAMALANEMVPTGGGSTDVPMTPEYESRVPGEVNLMAAEVVREARRSLRGIAKHAARLKRLSSGEKQMTFTLPSGKSGRPSVVTYHMVRRIQELRLSRHSVTSCIRIVALEYGVSERAIWAARERGEKGTSVERLLHEALLQKPGDAK